MIRADVVALYVDPLGLYPHLVRDWYDEKRDAKLYEGPHPVVAHPPCGPWGSLRHLNQKQDASCGPHGVEMVRRSSDIADCLFLASFRMRGVASRSRSLRSIGAMSHGSERGSTSSGIGLYRRIHPRKSPPIGAVAFEPQRAESSTRRVGARSLLASRCVRLSSDVVRRLRLRIGFSRSQLRHGRKRQECRDDGS